MKDEIIRLQKGQKINSFLLQGAFRMTTKVQYPAFAPKWEVLEEPEICIVGWEDDKYYYGNFVAGMGFFGLKFPKKSVRELTEMEKKKYKKLYVQHSNGLSYKLDL